VCVPYILTPPAQNAARKKQEQWTCYTKKYTNMYYTGVVGFSMVSIKMSSGCDAEYLGTYIAMFWRTAG
jgi:hypothetical protein